MKTRRRTETTIEAHEVWVVRGAAAGRASAAWCRGCSGLAVMLAPEDAGKLSDVAARTIYRWVEAGRVHFTETAEGGLLVCLSSLPVGDPPAAG